jgi:hypothetical protein
LKITRIAIITATAAATAKAIEAIAARRRMV